MKKLLFLIQLTAAVILYAPLSHADDFGWRGHGHHGRGHHGHYREHYYPQPQIIYYPPPVVHYYPQPQVHYYAQPQPGYYPQPQRQRYQDPRSTQGLAGGVIGSVFGYQMGNGDPVVTGLGAAAGSYVGNGMAGR